MRLIGLFVAFQLSIPGLLRAQAPVAAGHDHLTEVACVDVPAGEKRPDFGCFNVGTVSGLHFSATGVYWHLYGFPSMQAALAVKSSSGIIAEEDGRVWLSEFGSPDSASRGGERVAVIGPLQLAAAGSYSVGTFRTRSCGRGTRLECTRIPGPRPGTCSRASSVWTHPPVPSGPEQARP